MKQHDLESLPGSLLTIGNPKTAKGEKHGYLTAILHLAPHTVSGVANVCAHASAGCAAACLNTAGRGGFTMPDGGLNPVQVARIRRTRWFKRDKAEFMGVLVEDIERHIKTAKKAGLTPCVRLNGTSDIPWENVKIKHLLKGTGNIFGMFPDVQFYDYTKYPIWMRIKALKTDNYELTFSLSEDNEHEAKAALVAGVNVTVVFDTKKGKALPDKFWGHKIIDGDLTDLRFLDPKPVIVGLRAKGRGKTDESGFVRHG